jgi:hypothetical protein
MWDKGVSGNLEAKSMRALLIVGQLVAACVLIMPAIKLWWW